MAVNFTQYKETIKQASINARNANTIDEALEIQAEGYRQALETAVNQMRVDTNVSTNVITPNKINGTGTGTGLGTVS